MSGDRTAADAPSPDEEEIRPMTVVKVVLFLVWWFSGIGVGTGFISPGIIGTGISPRLFMIVLLTNFCSALLIIALIPGRDDRSLETDTHGTPEGSEP